MKLENKVAIVTGGANGIGKGLVEKFLQEGSKFVGLFDYSEAAGKDTERQLGSTYGDSRVSFFNVDVSNEEQLGAAIRAVYEIYKRIDILINNAGIADEFNPKKTILVNLYGVINGTIEAAKYMSKRYNGNGGVVINTASTTALYVAGLPVYTATKAGVVGFTRSLPSESADFKREGGIRVAAVCPSATETPLLLEGLRKYRSLMATGASERNFLKVAAVVEAYMKIIGDDTMNGEIVYVTPGTGIQVQEYEPNEQLLRKFDIYKDPEKVLKNLAF